MTQSKKLHPFDQAVRLTENSGIFTGETSHLYQNMVGPYGGMIAAIILNSVILHPKCLGDPLALTVNYAAPVKDGSFEIKPMPVRTNRSTQHWYITLSQENEIAAAATIVTAKRKITWSSQEKNMPAVKHFSEVSPVSTKNLPPWFNQYDTRPVKGSIPPLFEIKGEKPFKAAQSIQWIRDNPKRKIDFLSLTAFSDSPAPSIYVRRNKFVPAGTVSFSVYFHASREELDASAENFVLVDVKSSRISNNYCDQSGEIWSENNVILASTTQIIYFKE